MLRHLIGLTLAPLRFARSIVSPLLPPGPCGIEGQKLQCLRSRQSSHRWTARHRIRLPPQERYGFSVWAKSSGLASTQRTLSQRTVTESTHPSKRRQGMMFATSFDISRGTTEGIRLLC